MRLENVGHPVSRTLALARGIIGRYTDHGMNWDNSASNFKKQSMVGKEDRLILDFEEETEY